MKSFLRGAIWRSSLALAVGAGIIALFGPGLRYLGSQLRGPQDLRVYSSRQSPDGSLVAESVEVGHGEAGGRLIIRAKAGSERSIDFPEPPVDLFFWWEDDTHLELASYMSPIDLRKNDHLGRVVLSVRSFEFPETPPYEGPGSLKVAVPAHNVAATFARQANDKGAVCTLKLEASRTPSSETAGVEIAATVNTTCRHQHPCLAINTRFTLEDESKTGHRSTLTSATIADLRSYNRLPAGDHGSAIRGQFLGQNAMRLVGALTKRSVALNFSRDFFEKVINYELPLPSGATAEFKQCIGDAEAL